MTRQIIPSKKISGILGNKYKILSKVLEITFTSGYIIWRYNLHGYISYWRRSEKLKTHTDDTSINGLVASYTPLFKPATIFNTLPWISVDTWMTEQNPLSLISNTEWNISCTIHINISCIKERKCQKQIKPHINVS